MVAPTTKADMDSEPNRIMNASLSGVRGAGWEHSTVVDAGGRVVQVAGRSRLTNQQTAPRQENRTTYRDMPEPRINELQDSTECC
jgi:hypothetical protein